MRRLKARIHSSKGQGMELSKAGTAVRDEEGTFLLCISLSHQTFNLFTLQKPTRVNLVLHQSIPWVTRYRMRLCLGVGCSACPPQACSCSAKLPRLEF